MPEISDTTRREKEIIADAVRILREELAPAQIILFGSRAKGTHERGSDFDLAVDCAEPDRETKRRITERVEEASGLYGVDVVFLREVEPSFREIILETGKVLYEKRV